MAAMPVEVARGAVVAEAATQTDDCGAVLVTNLATGLTHFLAGGLYRERARAWRTLCAWSFSAGDVRLSTGRALPPVCKLCLRAQARAKQRVSRARG